MIFAYIDPGAGSLLLQALIAGALVIPYFFRQQIGRVVRRIRGDKADDAATTTEVNRDRA
jgi:hypothetical protein